MPKKKEIPEGLCVLCEKEKTILKLNPTTSVCETCYFKVTDKMPKWDAKTTKTEFLEAMRKRVSKP